MSGAERLALGTVQLGQTYGIANRSGQVGFEEAATIVARAREAGLDTLDTAATYGDSEQRLGEIGVEGWRVVSKLPGLPEETTDVGTWVDSSVTGSLSRLRIPALHGLLLHRPADLQGPHGEELQAALVAQRDRGRAAKIGVSVYGPDDLAAVWSRFQPDLVQVPFNVIDRRLVTSGWLERLGAAGVEIHARSAFLQGLLLMNRRPAFFERWQPLWEQWRGWLDSAGLDAVRACIGFALSQPGIDRVVVGVDGVGQLDDILANVDVPVAAPPQDLMSEDPDLIDPARWETP